LVFVACNLVIGGALVWTSAVVIGLERSELRARAESDYQESLRLAMWRMDSWLSLFLAREAARPRTDTPLASPAPDLESDYLLLRFEIDPDGKVTSPQVPLGPNERIHGMSVENRDRLAVILEHHRPYLRLGAVRSAVARADSLVDAKLARLADSELEIAEVDWSDSQRLKTQNEFDARVACTVPRPPGTESAGRQVIAWLTPPGTEGDPALVFLRRIESGSAESFQGFILDWPRVRERLLFEIRDLFPDAELERMTLASAPFDPLGGGLANIPATLVTLPPTPVKQPWITSGRATLALAWFAAIVAMVAVGATLRKSIDLGERRRRFVSAVTHELRTPLTTFQMYSEMLADGVVSSEDQRREYLRTLKDEARRLSSMVSNVLAHARLEKGRAPHRFEEMNLDTLISSVRPPLERRVGSSGMTLDVASDSSDSTSLTVDAEAIGRILESLVDNAAKYADGLEPPTIHLDAATTNGSLILTVRDHGPGVLRAHSEAIFGPFERGNRDPSDPIPGVGLGLALSRDLARDMGGDLTLETMTGRGAMFRLVLPTRPGRRRAVQ